MQFVLQNDALEVIVDSLGGEIVSIRSTAGLEYLWQGDEQYWSGQAPVLFPICGSLRNGRAVNSFAESIQMPRHGLVRKREFICEWQTDTQLVCSIETDTELLRQYPYVFKLSVHYQLHGSAIKVQYIVSNHSSRPMPFFIGAHPAFNCPLETDLKFTDYAIIFSDKEETVLARPVEGGLLDRQNPKRVSFNGKKLFLSHALFEEDALCFKDVQSKKVSLFTDKGKHGVTMYYADFPSLLIWSSANKGLFVALEPMCGLSTYTDEDDVFEHKENVQVLPVGESAVYSYCIEIY